MTILDYFLLGVALAAMAGLALLAYAIMPEKMEHQSTPDGNDYHS